MAATWVRRTRGVFSALALLLLFTLPHLGGRDAAASSAANLASGTEGSRTGHSAKSAALDSTAADSFSVPLRRRIDSLNQGLERVEPLGWSGAVGVFRSDSAKARSARRPPGMGPAIGLFVLEEGFLFGYSAIGYSEDGAAVLGGLDVLSGLWGLAFPTKSGLRRRSRVYDTAMSLSVIGLGAYMMSLDDQNAPKGRVVLHHFVGLNAAALACGGIDWLFSPHHGRRRGSSAGSAPAQATTRAGPRVASRDPPLSVAVGPEDSPSGPGGLEASSPECCLP